MTESYDMVAEEQYEILSDDLDEKFERNVTSSEEEEAFVQSVLGTEDRPTPTRDSEQRPEKQKDIQAKRDKTAPSFITKGGKEVRVVKDEWGSFWHVEFTSGGQLPAELAGSFTDEKTAELVIQLYLAKQ